MSFLPRVATAPISWGVCEVPGWGHQLTPERVLGEMRELGFTATELGSAGWLPEDPTAVREILGRFDLTLLASFVPLVMHVPEQADQALAEAWAAAQLLKACGASYFNTAPVTSADWEPRRDYSDSEWEHLAKMFSEVGEICAEFGLHQVVHEHVGCFIETSEDIDRLLAMTEVDFVLDTGHMAIGGCNPLQFAEDHVNRVGLVHLKDTVMSVAAQLNAGDVSLMEAVQAGLFPALGAGDIPLDEIISSLEANGYDGWYVVEQDCAITGDLPPAGEGPIRDVETSVAYLRNLDSGLNKQQRGGNP